MKKLLGDDTKNDKKIRNKANKMLAAIQANKQHESTIADIVQWNQAHKTLQKIPLY